jgi:hypothetical protein
LFRKIKILFEALRVSRSPEFDTGDLVVAGKGEGCRQTRHCKAVYSNLNTLSGRGTENRAPAGT